MIKYLFAFLFTFFFCSGNTQNTFQKKIGNFDGSRIYSVENTFDSGYIFLGSYDVAGFLTAEFYVVKVDKFGDTIFANTFGSMIDSSAITVRDGAGNEGYDVIQTKDSGYLLLGEAHGFAGTGSSDVYCIKIDKHGDYLWSKTYGGALGSDYGLKALELKDSGFYLVGYTESYGLGNRNMYVIRTDVMGDTLWTKHYGDSGIDGCEDAVLAENQGLVLAGYTYSSGAGGADAQVIKIDSLGNIVWQFTYGGANNEFANSLINTVDNGFLVTGSTQSFGAGQQDVLVFKIDSLGQLAWTKTYGGLTNEAGKSITKTHDGNYVITGNTRSFGQGAEDVFLMKINPMGDTMWSYTYGGNSIDLGEDVQLTKDNSFILAAYTNSFMTFSFDLLIMKVDSSGSATCTQKPLPFITGNANFSSTLSDYKTGSGAIVASPTTLQGRTKITVEDACLLTSLEEAKPEKLNLYPNPVINKVVVQLPLSLKNKEVAILIRDFSGKLIQTVSFFNQSTLSIDVSSLTPGIYVIQCVSNDQNFASKFIKVR